MKAYWGVEVSSKLHAPDALLPGNQPSVPIGQDAWWAPGPVWTLWRGEKSLDPVGNQSPIPRPSSIQPVAVQISK
jgi:hypothetical protein